MPFINNLISAITNLRTKVGEKLNLLYSDIGIKGNLTTANKTNLVGAVNEINSKFIPYDNAIRDVNLNNKSITDINNLKTTGLSISNLNGILKSIDGVVSVATPQVDYLTNVDLSSYATQSWVNSQGFLKNIPIATASVLGAIKVGSNLTITADGVLSAISTETAYTAGNGLTLNNKEFSLPITQSGSGASVKNVTQNTNGITVNLGNTDFSEIINKPTTLIGYGITDAMNISHPANAITNSLINNWNEAFSWGNHALAGYMTKNSQNQVTQEWGVFSPSNDTSLFLPIGTNTGFYIGSGGIYARYNGEGIFPESMVPSSSYQFQNLYFPQSTNSSRTEDRTLVTSINGVKADTKGNVVIDTGSGGIDPSNFLLKNSNNNVTENFSISYDYTTPTNNPDSFVFYSTLIDSVTPGFVVGVRDSNSEGVTMTYARDGIILQTTEGGSKSMVMDGRTILFDEYYANKEEFALAQMKDINDLKQWVIDNFLSLSGGNVNGTIKANSFEENI